MRRKLALGLSVLGIAFNIALVGPATLDGARRGINDFRHFYSGGRLAFTPDLYSERRVLEVQQAATGEPSRRLMPSRLPFYYGLIWPVMRLPYQAAHWLWTVMMVASIGLLLELFPTSWPAGLGVACAWSFPLVFSVLISQDVAFLLLALAVGLKAFRLNRHFLSGAALSLCLIKFNLFLLMPLLVFGRRLKLVAAGLMAGTALLLALSFIVGGWGWPRAYMQILTHSEINQGREVMPNLNNLTAGLPHSRLFYMAACAVVTGAVLFVVVHSRLEIAWAAAIAGSILVSHHAYLQDCAILAPFLVTVVFSVSNWLVRSVAAALLTPVPYILGIAADAARLLPAILLVAFVLVLAVAAREPALALGPEESLERELRA